MFLKVTIFDKKKKNVIIIKKKRKEGELNFFA